ncbi:hypothetical protein HYPSUDRAFT_787344 [Hypholoma sublateritium FD-334 SS-4]|uniref:Major facilitator superfamily (MFS) profile domain-containing protein n=1 Tax=Hypholoma sublateritium (strain FD-334 SS-4) TaxID=945553 RepID=A0A0D2L1H9_HYPSF|nr:hypothetical protein HYPSUDRAFT_787344 [Hypholoma sublateritium FD-334 SS-4]
MLWGPVSDHLGRRPISAVCLLILALSCIGLALVPTSAFWLLMLLRCLQAFGTASTTAIVLYRSIFWFLTICASVCVIMIILCVRLRRQSLRELTLHLRIQPETLPSIVDSGRSSTFLIYTPVIPIIGRKHAPESTTSTPSVPKPNIHRNPFRHFLNPDVSLMLAVNGMMFTVFYGVLVPLSSLFVTAYPFLNQTTVGACFLSIGGGTVFGSWSSGCILDSEYQRFKRKVEKEHTGSRRGIDINNEENFPLEKARLRLMPYYILCAAVICAGYGWCIERRVHIAIPLILQFMIGWLAIAVMNTTSTLNIDLVPGQSSSVTACNNLVRCSLASVLISTIQLIMNSIGVGWT